MPFTSDQAIRLHYLVQQEISSIRSKIKSVSKINMTRKQITDLDRLEVQLMVLRKLMRKAMK